MVGTSVYFIIMPTKLENHPLPTEMRLGEAHAHFTLATVQLQLLSSQKFSYTILFR